MDDIRTIRRKLGVTQIELADLLGLHQSTISRFEGGALPVDDRTRLALEALLARRAAIAVCDVCDRRASDPTVRDCIASNCGLREPMRQVA